MGGWLPPLRRLQGVFGASMPQGPFDRVDYD